MRNDRRRRRVERDAVGGDTASGVSGRAREFARSQQCTVERRLSETSVVRAMILFVRSFERRVGLSEFPERPRRCAVKLNFGSFYASAENAFP